MGKLLKALGFNNAARVYIIDSTDIIEKARKYHSLWPTASVALGRLLTITSMMGSMLKENQSLTIRFNGDGPLGHMLTTSTASGNVRGYVENPNTHLYNEKLKKLEISMAVGKGEIIVSKDLNLKNPYISQCEIISGEISEDLAYYFVQSEQIPTSISSGVLVNTDNSIISSGGFIIQLLPNCPLDTINIIESRLKNLLPISRMIENKFSLEDILKQICGNDYLKLDETDVFYECNCSKDKFFRSISTLSSKDLQEMIDENIPVETVCTFCNKKYLFNKEDLQEILTFKK